MRPTLLHFRSPKERTPDCYNPTLTFDGRRVSFSPVRIEKRTTFSNERRFIQYDTEARRTGYFVGPGSYMNDRGISLSKKRIKGTPVYKPLTALDSTLQDGYIMVGDQVVFDSTLKTSSKKNSLTNLQTGLSTSFTESFRSSRKRSTPRMKSAEKRTSSRLDTQETDSGQSPEKQSKSKSVQKLRVPRRIKSPYLSRVANDINT
jgi:hypothetical protein